MGILCVACGSTNPRSYRFCGECGEPIAESPLQVPLSNGAEAPAASVNQLSPEVTPLPVSEPAKLEGERRLVTVIVADVKGSTDLLERIGTEEWVDAMNRVLQLLEREVYRFGGRVDQFRGDGLVAFFGATSAHEDDPERAVLAGLAMQTALQAYVSAGTKYETSQLLLRVGINTGEVIVTSVGDGRLYREDTAMGEAVTVAQRLETAAEPGTVLVSDATQRLVIGEFEWQSLGEIAVKGLKDPVAVFRPLTALFDADPGHDLTVPLIGRDVEFELLLECVEELFGGRGGIALIAGDKGMGKSFLVREVAYHYARHGALTADVSGATLGTHRSLMWLRGRCRSYDQSWPYSMWLSMLRDWLGMRRGEPKEAARDRLRAHAQVLWGESWERHYVYLAKFLALPLEDEFAGRVKHLDAEGLRQQFYPTIKSWLETMAQQRPLVVSFADIHWADTTSLDLLRQCLPICDSEALLWLVVFRPDRTSPAWEFSHYVETRYPHRLTKIALPPLSRVTSGELIERLIGTGTLPEEDQNLVIDKAEGNPYYIGELVRSLVAQRILVQEPGTGRWRATQGIQNIELPDSLQSLLAARIDRLPPETRFVFQVASVIGSVFWWDVLYELINDEPTGTRRADIDQGALASHLTTLQREELVTERGRTPDLGMEYVFTSNLIRDAAYDGLLSGHRVRYHHSAATFLETHLGEAALPHFYGVLAYHYRQAGELAKELTFSLLAADQARGIYANSEAIEHYSRALDLLQIMEGEAATPEERREIHLQVLGVLDGRSDVHFLAGEFPAAREDCLAMLALARGMEAEPRWLIDALLKQPGVSSWQTREELEHGIALAEEALSIAKEIGDQRRELQSLTSIARQRLWINDPAAWGFAERALEMARELGDQRYQVGILIGMGQVYAWSDHPERGMPYLEAALSISQTLDDKLAEMELLELIGLQHERDGNYHRLLTEFQEQRLTTSREIGHRPVEADALRDCGQIRALYLGDFEGGLELLQECLRIWEGLPEEVYALLRIAQVRVAQGQPDAAKQTLDNVRRIISERAVKEMGIAGFRLVSAILLNSLGDSDSLRRVVDLADSTRQLVHEAPLTRQYEMAAWCEASAAHLGLSNLAADDDEARVHAKQALECSQSALDILHSFGFVQIIESLSEGILFQHSRALAANRLEEASMDYLRQAYDEMMRKHLLIPEQSPYFDTFLEMIPLHRQILNLARISLGVDEVARSRVKRDDWGGS